MPGSDALPGICRAGPSGDRDCSVAGLAGAVVTDPGQRHDLAAGGTQATGPSLMLALAGLPLRFTATPDTGLARMEGPHLFVGGQHRGPQDGAVPSFEVTAIGIVPQPRLRSRQRAVEVHRVHHVPDVRMLHHACHGITLKPGRQDRTYLRVRSGHAFSARPDLPRSRPIPRRTQSPADHLAGCSRMTGRPAGRPAQLPPPEPRPCRRSLRTGPPRW
jgi:hypothetical protein